MEYKTNNHAEQNRGNTLSNSSEATKLLRTAVMATVLLLTPNNTDTHTRKAETVSYVEAKHISDALIRSSPDINAAKSAYLTPVFIGGVLLQAQKASNELQIPKEFIVAHWLMESGKLQGLAVSKNNLGGILRGKRPAKFESLDDFRKKYVSILKKDGVKNTSFISTIAILHRKHYVFGESEEVYRSKVHGVSHMLAAAVGGEYAVYYSKATKDSNR